MSTAPVEAPRDLAIKLNQQIPARPCNPELLALARRSLRGHGESFGTLFDLTQPLARDYVWWRTDDEETTQRVLRTLYLTLQGSLEEIVAQRLPVEVWIFRTVREIATEKHGPFGTAVVAYGTENEQLVQTMKQLGSLEQECLVLRALIGFDMRTVAKILGFEEETALMLYYRATQEIAMLMRPDDEY